jgi:hypothetical protein
MTTSLPLSLPHHQLQQNLNAAATTNRRQVQFLGVCLSIIGLANVFLLLSFIVLQQNPSSSWSVMGSSSSASSDQMDKQLLTFRITELTQELSRKDELLSKVMLEIVEQQKKRQAQLEEQPNLLPSSSVNNSFYRADYKQLKFLHFCHDNCGLHGIGSNLVRKVSFCISCSV